VIRLAESISVRQVAVEANNVRPGAADDILAELSADIQLDHVSNPKVSAKTVNGTVTMTGPLAFRLPRFTTMAAMPLMMPHDVSFTLNAKVTEKGDIVSDFPLKYLPEPPPPGIRTETNASS
jgi:hypothetical protein